MVKFYRRRIPRSRVSDEQLKLLNEFLGDSEIEPLGKLGDAGIEINGREKHLQGVSLGNSPDLYYEQEQGVVFNTDSCFAASEAAKYAMAELLDARKPHSADEGLVSAVTHKVAVLEELSRRLCSVEGEASEISPEERVELIESASALPNLSEEELHSLIGRRLQHPDESLATGIALLQRGA